MSTSGPQAFEGFSLGSRPIQKPDGFYWVVAKDAAPGTEPQIAHFQAGFWNLFNTTHQMSPALFGERYVIMHQARFHPTSVLHLTVGDEDWTPTPEELTTISQMFMQAEIDPLGATVATRHGVTAKLLNIQQGATVSITSAVFAKVTDQMAGLLKQLLTEGKLPEESIAGIQSLLNCYQQYRDDPTNSH